MDRSFWEERLSGVSVYKNDKLLTRHSVIFMVGLLEAPYGFLRYTNDVRGKKSIYLNTATNNLEGPIFNYSCRLLNTANLMVNISSCFTL
jgi:hypothetical protein